MLGWPLQIPQHLAGTQTGILLSRKVCVCVCVKGTFKNLLSFPVIILERKAQKISTGLWDRGSGAAVRQVAGSVLPSMLSEGTSLGRGRVGREASLRWVFGLLRLGGRWAPCSAHLFP